MEYTLDFDSERATMTTAGRVDVAEVQKLVHELVDDPRFLPGMPILADHTALDARSLSSTDARTIAQVFVDLGARIGPSPLAVVVPDAVTYGVVRMTQAYAGSAPLKAAVFYSRAEADAWLAEQARRADTRGR